MEEGKIESSSFDNTNGMKLKNTAGFTLKQSLSECNCKPYTIKSIETSKISEK